MSDSATRSFALFSQEKLKSAVDTVNARRKRGLCLSLAAGGGVFLVLAASVYVFFSPYSALMGEHGISYWPLLFLAPASLALIAFSLVYILALRAAVKEFRATLVGRMAEHIDPAILHEEGKTIPAEELEGDLLSAFGGKALSGTDRFRGRVPGAAVRFSDLRVRRGGAEMLTGICFKAVMERRFALPLMVFPLSAEVSRSGFEEKFRAAGESVGTGLLRLDDPASGRQILVPSGGEEFVLNLVGTPAFAKLAALGKSGGGGLALSCRGDCLRVAVLSGSGRMDLPGMFEEFDFTLCREFCRAARLCLELTRAMAERKELWADGDEKNADRVSAIRE